MHLKNYIPSRFHIFAITHTAQKNLTLLHLANSSLRFTPASIPLLIPLFSVSIPILPIYWKSYLILHSSNKILHHLSCFSVTSVHSEINLSPIMWYYTHCLLSLDDSSMNVHLKTTGWSWYDACSVPFVSIGLPGSDVLLRSLDLPGIWCNPLYFYIGFADPIYANNFFF